MSLTPGQLTALHNLARKQAGEEVDWISISDARALTELGFAERNREGWNIEQLSEESTNKSSDEITREMLRGDEAKGHRLGQLDKHTVGPDVGDDGGEAGLRFFGDFSLEEFEQLDFHAFPRRGV